MIRVFDGHCDTACELWRNSAKLEENHCHIDLKKAGSLGQYTQIFAFCSLSGYAKDPELLLREPLRVLREEVERNADSIGFAKNTAEARSLNESGRVAAMLSIEGAEVIGCDPERLGDEFVMATMTWNADNALAGWHGSDLGLTDRGRAFVRACEERDIRVDVSHLGEAAFRGLADCLQKPIVASHSNARALWEHTRNLHDWQLRVIAQSGGTVGLNLYPEFLGEEANFDTMRAHLEHMLTVCGEAHVALGGDLDGCEVLPKGFDHVGSYAAFYEYLQSHGYSEGLLDRIFYTNLARTIR